MRVYGMPYAQVMSLPMKVFWHLSGTVPRLWADEQRQLLEVQTAAGSPEGAEQLHQTIGQLAKDPVVLTVAARIEASSVRDEEGIEFLKSLS